MHRTKSSIKSYIDLVPHQAALYKVSWFVYTNKLILLVRAAKLCIGKARARSPPSAAVACMRPRVLYNPAGVVYFYLQFEESGRAM